MKSNLPSVLITGGGSGIGLALARKFHATGQMPILVGRRETVLREAAATLPGARIHVADITCAKARSELAAQYPHITTLIHSAGIQHNSPFHAQSEPAICQELATNLQAPILLTHAFLPHLLQKRAANIVFITSALALVPKESAAIYCAGKAALHSFAQTLRWQLENTPVRVIDLMPPLVETAMTAGRGHGKISAETLAEAFWQGFMRQDGHICVGKSRWLARIRRISPTLAARLMRKS